MTDGRPTDPGETITFGGFTLNAARRLLTRDGVPLPLGSRALDILVALVSRAGQAVDKKTLMAEVWPDVVVTEASLRFHIAGLRKALGDGEDGARYLATLAGRGYCFVAPVSRSDEPSPDLAAGEAVRVENLHETGLPPRLGRVIGRTQEVQAILTRLMAVRFVTIVGSGGVGKTTVAVELGHDLLEPFAGGVFFVDLGAVEDPALAPATVASTLGLSAQGDDLRLIPHLRARRVCLILDSCEHLIDAVSALAEHIFAAAPDVHILATSRQALRVRGEQVHRLAPLASPPDGGGVTAEAALAFPAPRLFVERASAQGASVGISDCDAGLIADICRKLDGVPLAIELTAGRVEAYGLAQIAALLDERLTLSWNGRRGARPRHRSLEATLDWSYDLLSDVEQAMLRRLSVFVGPFTLEAARAVTPDGAINEAAVLAALAGLVAQSLVATDRAGPELRYRLLDATRAYASQKLLVEDGVNAVAARHADYYARWLEEAVATSAAANAPVGRAERGANLGNVQAALQWSFSAGGDPASAVRLAVAAMPLLFAMSLLSEVHRWSAAALDLLDERRRGGQSEMKLQGALGLSLMFLRGATADARAPLERALEIAEDLGDGVSQLDMLASLHIFHERLCEYRVAMAYAERAIAVARTLDDPDSVAAALALVGVSHHLAGNIDLADNEVQAALRTPTASHKVSEFYFGFDHRTRAMICFARNLWLRGRPRQAADAARDAIDHAAATEHPVTLCIALLWSISVFLWIGDFESAEIHLDRFIAHAKSNALTPYVMAGRGLKAELDIRRGEIESGVAALKKSLDELQVERYQLLTTPFSIVLSEGLAALHRSSEAMAVIEDAIRSVERNGDLYLMPELLRVRARVRLSGASPEPDLAEADLESSLEWSRRQGAVGWELRSAVDLARLWGEVGRVSAARALLEPLLERFDRTFPTQDAVAADHLLATLADTAIPGGEELQSPKR